MSKRAKIDHLKCKGCYYCIGICPRNAITKSGQSNPRGYDYVEIDAEKCNGCGACYIICPDCCVEIVEDEK